MKKKRAWDSIQREILHTDWMIWYGACLYDICVSDLFYIVKFSSFYCAANSLSLYIHFFYCVKMTFTCCTTITFTMNWCTSAHIKSVLRNELCLKLMKKYIIKYDIIITYFILGSKKYFVLKRNFDRFSKIDDDVDD